jgi:polysaccharide lyase-like protein
MRHTLAALAVVSALALPAATQAAPISETPTAGPSASTKTLKKALRTDLKRALATVRKLDLATVEAKGFTLNRIRALVAGKVSFAATVRSSAGSGQATAKRKRVTVTRGSRSFARRSKANVRLKPTKSGKKLFRATSLITLRVKATFAPRTGRRVSVSYKVTLKRKPGSVIPPPGSTPPPDDGSVSLIPSNATLLYSQTFDSGPPWSGLSTQCAHPVEPREENGDGYAHFEVRPGDPLVAGHERCEVSYGGFDMALPAGEYWYRTRARTDEGFPHPLSSQNWVTLQQWQEDRPAPGVPTGAVDAALFVNSGTSERMYLEGDHLASLSQSGVFDIHAWHDFVVHGVWTDQPNGYLEWWIDGVYVGRTEGVTSETGGRHFWKGGITRATDLDAPQSADVTSVQIYRAP